MLLQRRDDEKLQCKTEWAFLLRGVRWTAPFLPGGIFPWDCPTNSVETHLCQKPETQSSTGREALISDLVYRNFFFFSPNLFSKLWDSGKNGECRWVSQLSLLPNFSRSLPCQRAIRISEGGIQWGEFSTCHSFETHINIPCNAFWNLSRIWRSRVTAGLMFLCAISILEKWEFLRHLNHGRGSNPTQFIFRYANSPLRECNLLKGRVSLYHSFFKTHLQLRIIGIQ